MVEKVTRFKANDGSFHDTRHDAEQREKRNAMQEGVEKALGRKDGQNESTRRYIRALALDVLEASEELAKIFKEYNI